MESQQCHCSGVGYYLLTNMPQFFWAVPKDGYPKNTCLDESSGSNSMAVTRDTSSNVRARQLSMRLKDFVLM